MKHSPQSMLFAVFDKVLVAVLAVLAVFSVGGVLMRSPESGIDPKRVETLRRKIQATQQSSRHAHAVLAEDYLTRTLDPFRPTLVGVPPRKYLMVPEPTGAQPDNPFRPWTVRKRLDGEFGPKIRELPKTYRDAKLEVADSEVVKARLVWAGDRLRIEITEAAAGRTEIRIRRGPHLRKIPVTVAEAAKPKPVLGAPRQCSVSPDQDGVALVWLAPDVARAKVTGYVVLKAEGKTEPDPWLNVSVPKKVTSESRFPATRVKDGRPGPEVRFDGRRFLLRDRDVATGVPYVYQIRAIGKDDEGHDMKGPPSPLLRIQVKEAFKITFVSVAGDGVQLRVSKFVKTGPEDPGRRVEYVFRGGVRPGEPAGWVVRQIVLPDGTRLQNVDLSTGYVVLDILRDQRRIRSEVPLTDSRGNPVKGPDGKNLVRQIEENVQKVLLINERGRIKGLWRDAD